MERVILLNSGKTKSGTCVIEYAFKDVSEKYKKGYVTRTQYIDISELHDSFKEESFPMTCSADFGYQDTYNGQARKVITKLFDKDGKLLFQL